MFGGDTFTCCPLLHDGWERIQQFTFTSLITPSSPQADPEQEVEEGGGIDG